MGRVKMGQFEQHVLLAILRLRSDAYPVSIIGEIEARTGVEVSHAAVYVSLKRLEKKALVSSRLGDPTPRRGGKAKRFYTIAPTALQQLRRERDALLNMWDGLEEAR